MDRRQLLIAGLASPLAAAYPAFADWPVFIGDMHFHLFFFGRNPASSRPLAKLMADGNATLVAWSLVGDVPWIRPAERGLHQIGTPGRGEALRWFQDELARIKSHIAAQNLKIVRTPGDIDLALQGDPHVVLSVEGASFLDEDPGQLEMAYQQGVRHLQLVHYIKNPLGDMQTERPELGGLTGAGQRIVEECNRLGILVDLAHSTPEAVTQVLAISKAPIVWSHSSVTADRKPTWSMVPWRARQLGLDTAKAITEKGGVIGLWTLRSDVGETIDGYADRLLQMADWLGEDHVAFGTDMNAVTNPAITSYADLRRVISVLERRRVEPGRIRKLAIENYARVLRRAIAK